MTVIQRYSNVSARNRIGWINPYPLPSVPAGLTRLNLLRVSPEVSSQNYASNNPLQSIDKYSAINKGTTGSVNFTDTYMRTTSQGTGLLDPTWVSRGASGFTWLMVFNRDPAGVITGQLKSVNYSNVGFASSCAVSAARLQAGLAGSPGSQVNIPAILTPIMTFVMWDPVNKSMTAFNPSTSASNTNSTSFDTFSPTDSLGIEVGTSTSSFDVAQDNVQFSVGEWSRPLSVSEALSAYNSLKPWFADRGVVVA